QVVRRSRCPVVVGAHRSARLMCRESVVVLLVILSRGPPSYTLFPYSTLFRSSRGSPQRRESHYIAAAMPRAAEPLSLNNAAARQDRKSTRLNSSHVKISYAVFCLKKKYITSSSHSGSKNYSIANWC